MRKGIHYFISGIGFGSVGYLVNLLIYGFSPSWLNVLLTWLFSGCMGVAALIFEYDVKPWLTFSLHFLIILSLVIGMLTVTGWYQPQGYEWISFLMSFVMTYLAIYTYLLWLNHQTVGKINQKLKETGNNP